MKVDSIVEKQYFLIVTEGMRTEPIYFEFIKNRLPARLLDTVAINGLGQNTLDVVRHAIAARDLRLMEKGKPPYDEVWAVFDKDDFPPAKFNAAIDLAGKNGINSGHTNQAFELWYVLHFHYLDTAVSRAHYFGVLSDLLGEKYKKNDLKTVQTIFEKGDVGTAIKHARRLEKLHDGKTGADSCPCTQVHVLVERLLRYVRFDY